MLLHREPVLVAGSTHPGLAQSIAAHLGVALVPVRFTRFSNENLKVLRRDNVRDRDVFVVQTSCPPVNESLMETLHPHRRPARRRGGAHHRRAPVLPLRALGQAWTSPACRISARLVADLLVTPGANRILALDLHSPQIHGFFRVPVDHITAIPVLCRSSPRPATSRARGGGHRHRRGQGRRALRRARLGIVPSRSSTSGARATTSTPCPHAIVGDVRGRHALIVDDEIATGGTILEAAELVLRIGARRRRGRGGARRCCRATRWSACGPRGSRGCG
jgi:ribose-phosphate pyrophosphokinase